MQLFLIFHQKKIKANNVFDFGITNVKNLEKYSWASSTTFLKEISEIIGMKVDKIHQDSYKLLAIISRTDFNNEEECILFLFMNNNHIIY